MPSACSLPPSGALSVGIARSYLVPIPGGKRLFLRVSLLGLSLLFPLWARGAASPFPNIRHVIHISADGLGGVYLSGYLAKSPGDFPAIRRLRVEGAATLNARCDSDNSETEPNHTSMFTGRPALRLATSKAYSVPHGLMVNEDPGSPSTLHSLGNLADSYKSSVFDVVHDHGLSTAFFAGKQKFELFIRSYDDDHGAEDLVGVNNGHAKIDYSSIVDSSLPEFALQNSARLIALVEEQLTEASPGYTFVHLSDPDVAGHRYGWGSEQYRSAVLNIDRQLAKIFAMIEANPEMKNRTAILLTSDHGGGEGALTHLDTRDRMTFTVPMMLWGPGVPSGVDLYELFGNRAEPGVSYIDPSGPRQPLRNGDSGNLALEVLGLPAIPGSSLLPEFKPRVSVQRNGNSLVFSWPITEAAVDLQRSERISDAAWTKVTEGIVQRDGENIYTVRNGTSASAQFYRLSQTATR